MESKFISMKILIEIICDRVSNRFDSFIVIEGKRGLGKSTLGYKILRLVHREMKKRKSLDYKFFPKRDVLYTRKEILKFLHKWKSSALADELITSAFNRDFYAEDQKDLIKMLNMNRDHNNLLISCIPSFKVLDSQIKNLCCMKITVIRRGLAIIHTPNQVVYSADIWDERINEKIEREWLQGGVKNPQYSRLTTFRSYMRFPKLSEKQEKIYQQIKDEKRNIIAQEKGLADEDKPSEPINIIYNALLKGQVKNGVMLDGMLMAHNLNPETTKRKIRLKLKQDGNAPTITTLYSEIKHSKENVQKQRKVDELTELINKVKGRANE